MAVDEDSTWTTSRCHRLLRPLSSKLAKLRKELEVPRSAGVERRISSNGTSVFAPQTSPQKTINIARPSQKPRGLDKARDPDWRPGAKASLGAGKKTYGGRGAKRLGLQRSNSNTANASRPGEIAFTPHIARIGAPFRSSPQSQNSPLKRFTKNRGPLQVSVEQSQLGEHLPADLHKLIQGLSEAYANVLQATTSGDEKRWKGTRSLLGACLRKLPAYIELEEHFAKLDKLDENEDREVAKEIYEHLETQFEQRAGHGWRPFKQVVRAHGTSLLCDAITDAVLGLESLSVLVTHCLNVSAWDEAEKLLLSYIPLLEPMAMPSTIKADLFDVQRSPFLSLVRSFVDRTGRHHLLYDLLEHMVALELLPLEWLATGCMRPVWDRLVRTISDNDQRTLANAFYFFETITLASIGFPDERLLEIEALSSVSRRSVPSTREDLRQALSTTFSSLLTVLCSIALVNNGRDDDVGRDIAQRVLWTLDGVTVSISTRDDLRAKLTLLEADRDDALIFSQRALSFGFAPITLRMDGIDLDNTMASLAIPFLFSSINRTAALYSFSGINLASTISILPSLISSIARGTGRIWKDDGFEQLKRLVTPLMTFSGQRLPHKLWTLKRLALDAAMEFANGTGDREHIFFAREIENKMRQRGRLVITQSPEKNDSPTTSGGFRWEDGIGEWVACTPFTKQAIKRLPRKPVRALDLLPTPVQSEDERSSSADSLELHDGLPNNVDEVSMCNTTAFDEDDDVVTHSSPIKKAPRTSTSSLGKRTRTSSPMVVIPAKRLHMTPPDTPVAKFYPTLPEDQEKEEQDGPRRSHRSRNDIKALTSRLRTQSSRSSLVSRLCNLKPVNYSDLLDESGSDTEISDLSENHSNASSSSTSMIGVRLSRPSPRKRTRRACTDNDSEEVSERDELSKTPGRPRFKQRRTSGRVRVQGQREWWKVGGGVVQEDSDARECEDELSFD